MPYPQIMNRILVTCCALFLPLASNLRAADSPFSETHQFIFFAVLEGLYRDGLPDSTVDAILGESIVDNFVISCPICTPAYDAFHVFQGRPQLTDYKKKYNDFGGLMGRLTKEERAALQGEPEEKRKQVQALISRWIEARISNHNLSQEEEAALRKKLREFREKGSAALERFKRGESGKTFQTSLRRLGLLPLLQRSDPARPDDGKPGGEITFTTC